MVASATSNSPVIRPVTSSPVPSAWKGSTLKKLVTSVSKVSSEYLIPDINLKVSLTLYVV